jgi:tRNA (guanine37-N1)-methyltransferase
MTAFHFNIVTLFPELFDGFLKASLIGKAIQNDLLAVSLIDLRTFTHDRHRSVDDAPYGGGSGMVMLPGPIFEALNSLPPCHKVLLTPQGRPFCQSAARQLVQRAELTLFCGRYEGVDERARSLFDEEISLGDFVLSGGEVAAMAIVETISRLIPGVLGNDQSIVEESFSESLLEYPQYTRPEVIWGERVPDILISGDHRRIASWRRGQSLKRTQTRRPDLWAAFELSAEDARLLDEIESVNKNEKK